MPRFGWKTKMLKELTLTNCESHKKTVLPFSPGLNVFIGESDKGKSGVFRSFKKLMTNKPGGKGLFPLYWKGEPNIKAVFDDCTIIRNVSKNTEKNTYQLNEQKPIGAGTSVPPEIDTAVNMSDVNFQSQIDRAYLMYETPGERGRILNKYAGLDEIDTALTTGKEDVARLKREKKEQSSIVKTKKKELEEFQDIEEREQKVLFCQQLEQHTLAHERKSEKLQQLIQKNSLLETRLTKRRILLKSEEQIKRAKTLLEEFNKKNDRLCRLDNLIAQGRRIRDRISKIPDLDAIQVKITKADQLSKRIETCIGRSEKISCLVKKNQKLQNKINSLNEEIKKIEASLPDICSECGSVLK